MLVYGYFNHFKECSDIMNLNEVNYLDLIVIKI